MAEIVNLRQVRKARLRQQAEDAADQNRVIFGRTKAEKSLAALERQQALVRHEGHRLDAGQIQTMPPAPTEPSAKKPDQVG